MTCYLIALTAVGVDFVEGVSGHVEHLHVGTEFFNQSLNDGLCRCRRTHPDAFCGYLLTGVLKVEPHHTVELEFLVVENQPINYSCGLNLWSTIDLIFFYCMFTSFGSDKEKRSRRLAFH